MAFFQLPIFKSPDQDLMLMQTKWASILNPILKQVPADFLNESNVITITVSTLVGSNNYLIRSNSASAAITVTLPAISNLPVGKWFIIKDVGNGSFSTSIKANGSDTIDGATTYGTTLLQYDSVTLYNNGSSWDVI